MGLLGTADCGRGPAPVDEGTRAGLLHVCRRAVEERWPGDLAHDALRIRELEVRAAQRYLLIGSLAVNGAVRSIICEVIGTPPASRVDIIHVVE